MDILAKNKTENRNIFFLLVITAPNKPLGLNYMGGGANATKHIDAGTSFDLK